MFGRATTLGIGPHSSLTHKLSILQLNQATLDLPGSAIIRPTHKPSSRQNSFYKFGKKITVDVNNVRKILEFSRVRVRVSVLLV